MFWANATHNQPQRQGRAVYNIAFFLPNFEMKKPVNGAEIMAPNCSYHNRTDLSYKNSDLYRKESVSHTKASV
jgi:hypothetical protein